MESSEKKQVTVLFADISGFTKMSENMEAEDISKIINDCFQDISDIIVSFGGIIDKFIGDCIMALFGVPIAIEHASCNALEAAIEIKEQVYKFNKKHQLREKIDIHIGINSGEVVAGFLGSSHKKEYTVLGDPVNVASRLEDLSQPGQILVGDKTYQLSKESFNFHEYKRVKLKGKKNFVRIFELTGKKLNSIESTYMTPLIGRVKELNAIELIILKLLNGEGSVLNIVGEAGIGKTRILREILNEKFIDRCSVIKGACLSYGVNLIYYWIGDLIRNWVGIRDSDTQLDQRNKLKRKILTEGIESISENESIFYALLSLKLTVSEEEYIKAINTISFASILTKCFKDLLKSLSKKKALIIIIEDAHWIDNSSLEILINLFKLCNDYPVLFINLMRPNYEKTSNRLLEKAYNTIHLEPLTKEETKQFATEIAKNLEDKNGIIEDLIYKTKGNPFFIEEVMISLEDYSKSVSIPVSIKEVILSRIDILDEETKETLRIASVMGQIFWKNIINFVINNQESVDQNMLVLEKHKMILKNRESIYQEYIFRHALAQEIIYESLLRDQKANLHLKIAEAIERLFNERDSEFYGLLAYHYAKGGRDEEAMNYMVKAGLAAQDLSASTEALNYFQTALDIYLKTETDIDPIKLAQLEYNIGLAFQQKGLLEKANKHYIKASKQLGDRERNPKNFVYFAYNFIRCVLYLNVTYRFPKKRVSRQNELLFSINNEYLASLGMIDSERMFIESVMIWGQNSNYDIFNLPETTPRFCKAKTVCTWQGMIGLAKKIDKLVITNIKSKYEQAEYDYSEFLINFHMGCWDININKNIIEMFVKSGEFIDVAIYLAFLGIIYVNQNRDENFIILAELKKIAEEYDNLFVKRYYLELLYITNQKDKDYVNCLQIVKEIQELSDKIGEHGVKKIWLSYEIETLISLNRWDNIEKIKKLADKHYRTEKRDFPCQILDYLLMCIHYHLVKIEMILSINDKSEIIKHIKLCKSHIKEALKVSKKIVPYRPKILMYRGNLYYLLNKKNRAERFWELALKYARSLKSIYDEEEIISNRDRVKNLL